jgi:16S rRNA C967 or C1407 C5-methylase (RsmB/RsmF family)
MGRCAVTGINFQNFPDALVKHPFAPSIDRKLSRGGYTPDNVRLVCVAANFGMGQWGEEVFLSLARAAVELEDHRAQEIRTIQEGSESDWYNRLRERIDAAEKVRSMLAGEERAALNKRVAGLKATFKKGPKVLKEAGVKAGRARKRSAAAKKAWVKRRLNTKPVPPAKPRART